MPFQTLALLECVDGILAFPTNFGFQKTKYFNLGPNKPFCHDGGDSSLVSEHLVQSWAVAAGDGDSHEAKRLDS